VAETTPPSKPPRVLLTSFRESYSLPAKPANASAAVQDAFRQTLFLLGEEMATFERAMSLQLRIVAENAKAKGVAAAATFTLWSRAFTHLADCCDLMTRGSYASCATLLRMALETIAIEKALARDGPGYYEEWFADAVSVDKESAALVIERGMSKAATVLAEDERLGAAYRVLMEISMPQFGSSLLLAAPETSLQKAPLAFADGAFHLGWAELVTGWLLLLAGEQLAAARGLLPVSYGLAAEIEATERSISAALGNGKRCRVEIAGGMFVFQNFRRAASGQPKRVALC
jgi:hypothetical protein